MDFAQKLRMMRAYRGMTQQTLAEVAHIKGPLISSMETGKVLPGPEMTKVIRAALGWPQEANDMLTRLGQVLDREAVA